MLETGRKIRNVGVQMRNEVLNYNTIGGDPKVAFRIARRQVVLSD
jgi:hypothetical protein